jgi:hypothetical protein
MSKFSIDMDSQRPCRYVFEAYLWNNHRERFSDPVDIMLDTGSFNTVVHKSLVTRHGVMTHTTMPVSIGGYRGNANICVLHKIRVGGHIMEKVLALAVPFDGELKNYILLGANVTKNWNFTVSSAENRLDVVEQFPPNALAREYPYRYCFNNKGQIMAFQELDLQ